MITNKAVRVGRRINGVAGQYAYRATVTYVLEDGTGQTESTFTGTFWSNVYGGPIYAPGGHRVDTVVLDHIGRTLDLGWIARFYGLERVEVTP